MFYEDLHFLRGFLLSIIHYWLSSSKSSYILEVMEFWTSTFKNWKILPLRQYVSGKNRIILALFYFLLWTFKLRLSLCVNGRKWFHHYLFQSFRKTWNSPVHLIMMIWILTHLLNSLIPADLCETLISKWVVNLAKAILLNLELKLKLVYVFFFGKIHVGEFDPM